MSKTNSDVVSRERWQKAQEWEEGHWVRTQTLRDRYFKNLAWRILSRMGVVSKFRGDDWNLWWKSAFADYQFLPAQVENAIEVGCGPYTNLRHMLDHSTFKHLILSDPLIRTYARFRLTFVSQVYRTASAMLDNHATEDLPFASDYFDLVVMINVLDHVQNARLCMDNVTRMVSPNGILILGQDLTDETDILAQKEDPGQIGHPIKLRHEWFEPWLEGRFQPILQKVLPRKEGRNPSHHYGTMVYAGKKVAS